MRRQPQIESPNWEEFLPPETQQFLNGKEQERNSIRPKLTRKNKTFHALITLTADVYWLPVFCTPFITKEAFGMSRQWIDELVDMEKVECEVVNAATYREERETLPLILARHITAIDQGTLRYLTAASKMYGEPDPTLPCGNTDGNELVVARTLSGNDWLQGLRHQSPTPALQPVGGQISIAGIIK